MHNSVLLLSIPDSGNTWIRPLLEYSKGIYTGSVFTDQNQISNTVESTLLVIMICVNAMVVKHHYC